MTAFDLQTEIINALENDLFSNMAVIEPGEIKVFRQYIPLSTEFENEEDDEKYYPCCIVKFGGGEIKTPDEPQITTIEIDVAIKDDSADMSGFETLVIILERIRDYFTGNVGIHKKARMLFPVEIYPNSEPTPPYFIGAIITKWANDYMPYKDIEKFL